MVGSVNKVVLIGNIGKDPEIRNTNTGNRIALLSLATSDRWKDRESGQPQERTEWHRVVVFNENLVDVIEKYVNKGTKIYVEGQLQTRKWQDQNGQDRYTTEVVLSRFKSELVILDKRADNDNNSLDSSLSQEPVAAVGGSTSSSASSGFDDLDDDIPF